MIQEQPLFQRGFQQLRNVETRSFFIMFARCASAVFMLMKVEDIYAIFNEQHSHGVHRFKIRPIPR
jgi:hypothetical protein